MFNISVLQVVLVDDEQQSCVSALGQYEQELRDLRKHLN